MLITGYSFFNLILARRSTNVILLMQMPGNFWPVRTMESRILEVPCSYSAGAMRASPGEGSINEWQSQSELVIVMLPKYLSQGPDLS